MTDVLLTHEPDGGNIEYIDGNTTMDDGLYVAVYLSLFGGNERDSGLQGDDARQWWANLAETDATRRYRSELQYLFATLPLVPMNLRRFEDAAVRDLAWFVDSKTATFVGASASIPALNTVALDVQIEIDGRRFEFSFTKKVQAQLSASQVPPTSSAFGQLAFDQEEQSAHLLTTL